MNFPRVRKLYLDLSSARDLYEFQLPGNNLRVSDATDNSANVLIRFDETQNEPVTCKIGRKFKNWPTQRIFITNTAQASKFLEFEYWQADLTGQPEIVDEALQVTFSSGIANTPNIPGTLESTADVSLLATATTQILAENLDRKEALITNLSSNTQTFRIWDSNAGATRGTPVEPGQTITINNTDAIHGYNPGGTAESVAAVESES